MITYIEDSAFNTGKKVGVTEQGRLGVDSISKTILENASENGDSYNVNTGTINLTTANESSLLYLKNNGDPITVVTVGFLIGNSTGGSGDALATVLRNPTSGTIVSGATNVDININKNFSSNKELVVDAYKGAEGNTFTDGDNAYFSLLPGAARGYVIATGGIYIGKGASIGVKFTPPSGNTGMDIQVFLSVAKV